MLYFAYGSNMDSRRLKDRVGNVPAGKKAVLRGYELRFDKLGGDGTGKGNIVPSPGKAVEGVVYELTEAQMKILDTYEHDYRREEVSVESLGDRISAVAYVANKTVEGLRPSEEYLRYIIDGAEEHGLSQGYVRTSIDRQAPLRRIFKISLVLKGLNALLEVLGGILFLFTGYLTGVVELLIHGELIEDPRDLIANLVQHYLPYLSSHTQFFVSFYLLSHGVIKGFLIIALLRRKLWAYPSAIVVFTMFILYQLYRFSGNHSIFLALLTIFDLAIIWLTWREYKALLPHIKN